MLPFFTSLSRFVLTVLFVLFGIVIDERAIVVPMCIPGHCYLLKMVRGVLGEMGNDVGVAFGSLIATAFCG